MNFQQVEQAEGAGVRGGDRPVQAGLSAFQPISPASIVPGIRNQWLRVLSGDLPGGHATTPPMSFEIERKFLLASNDWRQAATSTLIRQGYLSRDPDRTVRIRVAGDEAVVTIKGRTSGISRAEFEFPVPVKAASAMLEMCIPPLIEKTRHEVIHNGWKWEIDEFHGANEGLIVAEIELPDEHATPSIPSWIGQEVSHLPRYYNSNLTEHPYSEWIEQERSGDSV